LRRIVEGLPNAGELLALMLRKGATKPEDFKRLFAEDEEFRDRICKSLRWVIKVWVTKRFSLRTEDLEDLTDKVLVEVLVAVESRYEPTKAPLLSYCQPYLQKAYDEFDRLVMIWEHELLESTLAESILLEDENDEWESFFEKISAGSSPEDEAVVEADLEKLAEHVGFASGASLLAALEDPNRLSKVERHRLRRRILKEMRAMGWVSQPNGESGKSKKGGRPK
jgi:hypothetical protein